MKIGELLSQDLSAKDSVNLVNGTASKGDEKEDAVDALLEVTCEMMPENPELGCEPIRPVNDASEKANSGNKQMLHGMLPKRAGDQNRIEDAEKSAGPSATLNLDANSKAFLRRLVAWLVAFLRDFSWDSTVSIPHKDYKPAEERGNVLGNTDFHQGLVGTPHSPRWGSVHGAPFPRMALGGPR